MFHNPNKNYIFAQNKNKMNNMKNCNYVFIKEYNAGNLGVIKKGIEVTVINNMVYVNGMPLYDTYQTMFKNLLNDPTFVGEYLKEDEIIRQIYQ